MNDLSLFEVIVTIITVLGGGKLLEITVSKMLNRRIDAVSTEKVKAEVESVEAATAKSEVETVRQVLQEVKDHSATKDKRIDELSDTVRDLTGRLSRMEEREHQSHALTAAHELWDIQSYQRILMHDAEFPPPPPLRAPFLVTSPEANPEASDVVD